MGFVKRGCGSTARLPANLFFVYPRTHIAVLFPQEIFADYGSWYWAGQVRVPAGCAERRHPGPSTHSLFTSRHVTSLVGRPGPDASVARAAARVARGRVMGRRPTLRPPHLPSVDACGKDSHHCFCFVTSRVLRYMFFYFKILSPYLLCFFCVEIDYLGRHLCRRHLSCPSYAYFVAETTQASEVSKYILDT